MEVSTTNFFADNVGGKRYHVVDVVAEPLDVCLELPLGM